MRQARRGKPSASKLFEPYTAIVVSILFLSTLTRSAFGFGDALVAMPLLALLIPLDEARPIVACVSITTSCMILARDWRSIHFGSSWKVIVSAAVGIPLGFYVARHLDERVLKICLAAIITLFALYNLLRLRPFVLRTDRSIWAFGLVAGVLSGAYNAPGPSLVIFGTLRQWRAEQFRATVQSIVLPLGVILVLGHWMTGLLTVKTLHYYWTALPVVLFAVVLGRWIHFRFRNESFRWYVNFLLLVSGGLLFFQSLNR